MTRPSRAPRYALQLDARPLSSAGSYLLGKLQGVRGAETAVRLLDRGLADTTQGQYSRLFADFADYCAAEGLSYLPASQSTVFCYIGYVAEKGTWAADSMQPIFSAINDAHRALGLDPPALRDHFLQRARAGMSRAQAELQTRDTRIPLPAEAALAVLDEGEHASSALHVLREDACIALTSLFGGRQDTSVHLRSQDVRITADFIWLRLSEKGKKGQAVRRVLRLPLRQRPVAGHLSAVPRVAALLDRYFTCRDALTAHGTPPDFAFQLPGEARPTTRSMETWLANALTRLGISAPPGFAYQGHSLRSMGASSMAAIGVERHLYTWICGWARGSEVVEKLYIDPTVLPDAACYAFYGWALSRQYAADAGVVVAATRLPDPLHTPPAETSAALWSAARGGAARAAAARIASRADQHFAAA